MRRVGVAMTGLVLAVVVSAADAESKPRRGPCSLSQYDFTSRPDPDGVPTRVSVGAYVIDLSQIDHVEETFRADLHLELTWKDARLVDSTIGNAMANCKVGLDDVWNPQARFLNERELARRLDNRVTVDAEGTVTYVQRFAGTFATPLSLRDFPFDVQVLQITLLSVDHGPEEVEFVVDARRTGQTATPTGLEWSLAPGAAMVSTQYFPLQELEFTRYDYEISASRHWEYYIWRAMIPLSLIVFMSWLVFWMDHTHFASKVHIALLSMLTMIAFEYALGNLLPRVSYLTRVDIFALGCLVLVFLALVETVVGGVLEGKGRHTFTQGLHHGSRWVFPLGFALVVTFALYV